MPSFEEGIIFYGEVFVTGLIDLLVYKEGIIYLIGENYIWKEDYRARTWFRRPSYRIGSSAYCA